MRVGGLASYDLSQPGTMDANFAGVPRLTLADEGNRPVFVSTASHRSAQRRRVGVRVAKVAISSVA